MPVRTTRPFFRIEEDANGISFIRLEPSGEGDKLHMFEGSTGGVALHLKAGMSIRSATEVARFLNAVIAEISEQD